MKKMKETGAISCSGNTPYTRKWGAVDNCVMWRVLATLALEILHCLKSYAAVTCSYSMRSLFWALGECQAIS